MAKYDTAGNFLWVRQGGAGNHDQGAGIAVDGSGNVYVTGSFHLSATFDGVGILSAGIFDWFVAKYNTSGSLSWVKAGGRAYGDRGYGIAVEGDGNSFVTGYIDGDGNPSGNADMFVAKYDPAGNQVWLKEYGDSAYADGHEIAVDSSGNLYLVGSLNFGAAAPNPVSFGGITLSTAGNADVLITKLGPGGNVIWAKTAGGVSDDIGYGVAVGVSGEVYFTGSFASSAAFGNITLSGGINTNVFVAKITSPPVVAVQPQSQAVLSGTNVTLTVDARGTSPLFYQWYFNQTNLLAGLTNAALTLTNVALFQAGTYSVLVSNIFGSVLSSNALLLVLDNNDVDHDGIPNHWELLYGLSPTNAADANLHPVVDGQTNRLTYLQVYLFGLEPTQLDFNSDGISDYDELFVQGTNPLLADTDGDGIPDGWEIQHGLNPRFNDAADDLDGDGLSNLAEYQWNLAHAGALDPRNRFSTSAARSDFAVVTGAGTNRFYYDRTDRLVGAEYDRGLSLACVYDGNGNLTRQVALRHDANTNGLPDLWEFLHGLTNNASAYTDTDGDGWTDWQEWKAGTNPRDPASAPNLLGNPGTQVASLHHSFTPSNFVVGVGQLDGLGAEEIVLGADGDPGTNVNFMLVLTQSPTCWETQRVDVGAFGITSIAVGQVTNRPGPGIYVGLRGATNGSGRVLEFLNSGGVWQSNLVALATNEAAFLLGVRGHDVLVSLATTNAPDGSLSAANFTTNWSLLLLDTNTSHRGLGTVSALGQANQSSLRLLDAGGIQAGGGSTVGLMAYYPFDGNSNDASGNGNNGTNSGVVWVNGVRGGAAEFNGINAFIEANAFPDSPSFSFAAWLFVPSVDSTRVIFMEGDTPAGYVELEINSADYLRFFVKGVPSYVECSGVPIGRWFHCAGVGDAQAGLQQIWIDGAKVAEQSFSGQANVGYHSRLQIGRSDHSSFPGFYFKGKVDDLRFYNRVISRQEITDLAGTAGLTLPEPSATRPNNWRGGSLASGFLRGASSHSVLYAFTDDQNSNSAVDFADDFVVAEYLVTGTNTSPLTLSRQPIALLNPAQSYGLASVNFLNSSNEVFFTGEPDGQVFAWTATGATNPLQRQLFSGHHAGKAWHALACVKTLDAGEALIGLRVDPASPRRCDVILWSPQTQLPALANLPNTSPAAAVLPSSGTLGGQAAVTVRLWDAEGNASTPFLQYQISGTTNWQDAVLTGLNGGPYSVATRVAASPAGQNHAVVWHALADLDANTVTNVLLRARARDMTSLGDWSLGTSFQVNTVFAGNVGNEPAFGLAQRLADGRFQLSVTGGQLGQNYILQASTNLVDWVPVQGYVFTNPPITIIDPDAANFRWRFYRIGPPVSLPAGTLTISGNAPFTPGLNLLLYVTPGVNYQIEASTDLVHWSALTNITGTLSPFPFHDPAATNFDRRFYRAVRP